MTCLYLTGTVKPTSSAMRKYDKYQVGCTVFSQGIVSVLCDELGDRTTHLLELILAHLLVLVGHVSIMSLDDRVLKIFAKVGAGP